MPQFDSTNMNNFNANGFRFSGTRIEALTAATEYTLVTILRDTSGSVQAYKSQLADATRDAIRGCKKDTHNAKILVRVIDFASNVVEIHGFKKLSDLSDADINKGYACTIGGITSAYDAMIDAATATVAYAKTLSDADFTVNSIMFMLTDGCENGSRNTISDAKSAVAAIIGSEDIESNLTIVVGCNTGNDPAISNALSGFTADFGLNQYEEIANFTDKSAAKLGGFISRSVSSQSSAIGTGGPSNTIGF